MEPDLEITFSKIDAPEKIMDLGVQEGFYQSTICCIKWCI